MNACEGQKNAAPFDQSRRTLNVHFKNIVRTLAYWRALWFVSEIQISFSLTKFKAGACWTCSFFCISSPEKLHKTLDEFCFSQPIKWTVDSVDFNGLRTVLLRQCLNTPIMNCHSDCETHLDIRWLSSFFTRTCLSAADGAAMLPCCKLWMLHIDGEQASSCQTLPIRAVNYTALCNCTWASSRLWEGEMILLRILILISLTTVTTTNLRSMWKEKTFNNHSLYDSQ